MDKQERYKYVFGPVPSRRLGRSLGVDIIPPKNCSFDCVYCQLGRTSAKTVSRQVYAPVQHVIAEVKKRLDQGAEPDHITLAGSGEPTLHSRLADIIDGIKEITDVPVALLTNGSMFHMPEVRDACAHADIVLPSLDASNQSMFEKINRPDSEITFDRVIRGLKAFRAEYDGRIWLELFMIREVNTSREDVEELVRVVDEIRPDKIHLNTAVRPTAENDVAPVPVEELEQIAARFGDKAEIVAGFMDSGGPSSRVSARLSAVSDDDIRQSVLDMVIRRPCSVEDIARGLTVSKHEAEQCVNALLEMRAIVAERRRGSTFFRHAANTSQK